MIMRNKRLFDAEVEKYRKETRERERPDWILKFIQGTLSFCTSNPELTMNLYVCRHPWLLFKRNLLPAVQYYFHNCLMKSEALANLPLSLLDNCGSSGAHPLRVCPMAIYLNAGYDPTQYLHTTKMEMSVMLENKSLHELSLQAKVMYFSSETHVPGRESENGTRYLTFDPNLTLSYYLTALTYPQHWGPVKLQNVQVQGNIPLALDALAIQAARDYYMNWYMAPNRCPGPANRQRVLLADAFTETVDYHRQSSATINLIWNQYRALIHESHGDLDEVKAYRLRVCRATESPRPGTRSIAKQMAQCQSRLQGLTEDEVMMAMNWGYWQALVQWGDHNHSQKSSPVSKKKKEKNEKYHYINEDLAAETATTLAPEPDNSPSLTLNLYKEKRIFNPWFQPPFPKHSSTGDLSSILFATQLK